MNVKLLTRTVVGSVVWTIKGTCRFVVELFSCYDFAETFGPEMDALGVKDVETFRDGVKDGAGLPPATAEDITRTLRDTEYRKHCNDYVKGLVFGANGLDLKKVFASNPKS